MRAKRTDENQAQIVKLLRRIPGITVKPTHMVGEGFPDICVGFRGQNYFFEIKDPAKPPSARKLTPDEEEFHKEWAGQIAVILTVDDALKHLKLVA